MELKRYRITGPGSLTRWEHNGIPAVFGQAPHPDAILVYHAADQNAELLLSAKGAEANAHMRLVPILERDTINVRASTEAAVEAAVKASEPAAAVTPTEPAAAKAKAPRAPRAAGGAAVTSKLG